MWYSICVSCRWTSEEETPIMSSNRDELELQGIERDSSSNEANDRPTESKHTRTCVLLGSALMQIPIWGFPMSYGIFQEYYTSDAFSLEGNRDLTGIIGTTSNGVIYLSMPLLFALFTIRWARYRQTAAFSGSILLCLGYLASSFSTNISHLVATQGVLAALGCALVYSPITLSLSEWFTTSNRALALGVILSCKNIVGSTCPWLFRVLLDRYGFRTTLRVWTGICALSILAIVLIPTHPSRTSGEIRSRKIPWHFLRHQTFYIYVVAIVLQSSGYGIPQSFLISYAHGVTDLSQTLATLLLTLFNIPGIASSTFFGYLSDNKRFTLSAAATTAMSAVSSALAALLLWGLTSQSQSAGSLALLVLFSVTFGFFASGYSGTWGGILLELEKEAADANEAVDTGLLYGLLNGARGIGYVGGGLAAVELLKAGKGVTLGSFAYGTSYGPLILFTGLSSVFGGWSLLWKCNWRWRSMRPLVR